MSWSNNKQILKIFFIVSWLSDLLYYEIIQWSKRLRSLLSSLHVRPNYLRIKCEKTQVKRYLFFEHTLLMILWDSVSLIGCGASYIDCTFYHILYFRSCMAFIIQYCWQYRVVYWQKTFPQKDLVLCHFLISFSTHSMTSYSCLRLVNKQLGKYCRFLILRK